MSAPQLLPTARAVCAQDGPCESNDCRLQALADNAPPAAGASFAQPSTAHAFVDKVTAPESKDRAKPLAPETPAAVPAAPASQSNHLLRGSIWMIGVRWAMRLIGLVSTMILARLLAPDDFGLIAMVMLTYGLLETISYAGAFCSR